MSAEDFERVPCDDGMCTGIVGSDGRCGTCGRASEHTPTPASPEPDGTETHDEAPNEGTETPSPQEAPDEARDGLDEPAPDERVLCDDDMCTGILGIDGACGTCGRVGSPR